MYKVAIALTGLAVTLNTKITTDRLTAYTNLLTDLDEGSLIEAIQEIAKEAKFYPKPGEIREKATEITQRNARLSRNRLSEPEGPTATDEERKKVLEDNAAWKKKMGWRS